MNSIVSKSGLGSCCIAALLAGVLVGCAGGPFAEPVRPTREDAIAHCIEATPVESVLYADRFAGCMEEQGWKYSSPGS